ncbi:MAG: acetyl-CoA C-acyltransferase, partial [Chloroflexi bacterium]|nr:acetyl-CoA C-acyltransferase [Chloroflexota bacterium]
MEEIVITGYARTAFGKLGGALSGLSAVDLGACAIGAVLERANVPADQVDHVIMGTVITAGLGQIPARQAALQA